MRENDRDDNIYIYIYIYVPDLLFGESTELPIQLLNESTRVTLHDVLTQHTTRPKDIDNHVHLITSPPRLHLDISR